MIDQIYIINLAKEKLQLHKCIHQLNKESLNNYTIFEAINSKEKKYDEIYEMITSKMDYNFQKNNFARGALGCLLSHLAVIKDAKNKKYKEILILEDDFILIKSFKEEFEKMYEKLPKNWDLVYVGKKQGNYSKYDLHPDIHIYPEYMNIISIDSMFYKPNYQTWATHALLIKNTIFNSILEFEKNIIAPIDIMLMSLYKKYNFYSLYRDLIITDESESSIIKKDVDWKWNIEEFNKLNVIKIERIFIVGFDFHHTHSYIHEMYYNFFRYYYPNLYVEFNNSDDYLNYDNCLIIVSPIHFTKNIIYNPKNYYFIHLDAKNFNDINDDFIQKYTDNIRDNIYYIILLCREKINGSEYFKTIPENKYICMPWFCKYLYEDSKFSQKYLNKHHDKIINNTHYLYFGSVWNCNIEMIKSLILIMNRRKIRLVIKGRIFDISREDMDYIINNPGVIFEPFIYKKDHDFENSIEYILNKYPIKGIMCLQGSYHDDNYISNRIFESISLGYLIMSNNQITKKYFKSCIYDDNIDKLIDNYEAILRYRFRWMYKYRQQYQEYIDKFYGYMNITNCIDFFNEIINDKILLLDHVSDGLNYNLYCCHSLDNKEMMKIKSNYCIRRYLKEPDNIIIYHDILKKLDPYLVKKIMTNINYNLYIDKKFPYKDWLPYLSKFKYIHYI